MNLLESPVILFDGYCNLCSGAVQFVLRHEKQALLKFASLQSPIGQTLLKHYGIDPDITDSLVLIEAGKSYVKSSGALRITRYLKGGYPLLSTFRVVPTWLRDAVYDWVARHRYRWFGRKTQCWVPTPELKQRFLDA